VLLLEQQQQKQLHVLVLWLWFFKLLALLQLIKLFNEDVRLVRLNESEVCFLIQSTCLYVQVFSCQPYVFFFCDDRLK
jgi:hypothetical protein